MYRRVEVAAEFPNNVLVLNFGTPRFEAITKNMPQAVGLVRPVAKVDNVARILIRPFCNIFEVSYR